MGFLDDESPLRPEDFAIVRMPTGKSCTGCEQDIEADDDVALIQVVQTQIVNGQLQCYPMLDNDGDFKYSPQFFHLKGCWQDVYHDMEQAAEDLAPKKDRQEALLCEICRSSIREWEVMSLAQYGEFFTSPRQPSDSPIYNFKPFGGGDVSSSEICLSCTIKVTGSALTEWEDLSENGECTYCSMDRCWRVAQCSCDCHS